MRLTLDLPDAVRVVAASDVKGNPLTVVLIGGAEVLYASGHEPGGLAPEHWEDVFRQRVAHIFARLLLQQAWADEDETWSTESPTGRETWGSDSTAYDVHLTQEREAGQ